MDEQPLDGGFTEAQDVPETEESEAPELEAEEVETEEAEELPEELEESTEEEESEESEDTEEEAELYEITLDDGTTLNVPQSARDAFMKNADYTQKTQQVAEQRKALESDRVRFEQAIKLQTQFSEADTAIRVIDNQLSQYEGIDWNAWAAQDPMAAQQAQAQLGGLREQRVGAVNELNRLQAEAQKAESQEIARVTEENKARIKTAIPNWSTDTEKAIFEYGLKSGFSERQLASTNYNPVMLGVLNKARLFDELQSRQAAKPKPKPIPKAGKVKAKKSPPKTTPEDSDSAEEWMRKRNAQLAKKAASR